MSVQKMGTAGRSKDGVLYVYCHFYIILTCLCTFCSPIPTFYFVSWQSVTKLKLMKLYLVVWGPLQILTHCSINLNSSTCMDL